jgi:hypothetical protein
MLRIVGCRGDGAAMEINVAVSAITGNGPSEPRRQWRETAVIRRS